jgi:hypothetical protein
MDRYFLQYLCNIGKKSTHKASTIYGSSIGIISWDFYFQEHSIVKTNKILYFLVLQNN